MGKLFKGDGKWENFLQETEMREFFQEMKRFSLGDDGSIWAASRTPIGETFNISAAEANNFASLWKNMERVFETGFTLEGFRNVF